MEKDYYACYFDGACEPRNPKGNLGIGAFILSPERKRVFEFAKYIRALELNYETSNNVAEYMGLLAIFGYFKEQGLCGEKIIVAGDSKLVINQMNGSWGCNGGIYEKYFYEARKLRADFKNISFRWIPREQNSACDELSKREMIKGGCEFRIQPL